MKWITHSKLAKSCSISASMAWRSYLDVLAYSFPAQLSLAGTCLLSGSILGFWGLPWLLFCVAILTLSLVSNFFYLGVAAVMGLAGKEQDRVVSILWRNLLGKFGIEESAQCKLDDRNDKESKEHNE